MTIAIAIITATTATNKSYLRRAERCFTCVLYIGAQSLYKERTNSIGNKGIRALLSLT